MAETLQLPVIDLSCSDRLSTAKLIRQACTECGFFYLSNHGVKEELLGEVLSESRKFFSLPVGEKMKLVRKEHRGYSALYEENLDPASSSKGDSKESYYIGALEDPMAQIQLNQWPSEDILPSWRPTVESYYRELQSAGKRLLSLIALSLELDEDFFERVGGLDKPTAYLRLLHYPGHVITSQEKTYGASAHSDYGMITLLGTDGVPGLQICRDKSKHPRIWEDVPHIEGAFIVNIGDMMERWTNCLFRSTLHRVMPVGQERYSVAFFLDPDEDCIVECIPSCCSESCPPRFDFNHSVDFLSNPRIVGSVVQRITPQWDDNPLAQWCHAAKYRRL